MKDIEIGPIRPPSESNSLLIRVTRGCHWNKCYFCGLYKSMQFSMRPIDETIEDIRQQAQFYQGKKINFCFLQDGDALVLKTDYLLRILDAINQYFPDIQYITSYARADSITRKTPAELKILRQAGLNHLYCGMETGSAQILRLINKGFDSDTVVRSGCMAKDADMILSEFILLGIGGKELSEENAIQTAKALNVIQPDFIRVHATGIKPESKLGEFVRDGSFTLQSEEEIVIEQKMFLQQLQAMDSYYVNEHIINLLLEVRGNLRTEKQEMLSAIDRFLSLSPDEKLLFTIGRRLNIFFLLDDTMCRVTILDENGIPVTVEVSREIYQVFVDYEREVERQRKADFRHRDARSWDTCLIFEVSTETLEQTYERIRTLHEIQEALNEFTPKQRRRFLLHFAYGYTYMEIAKMEGSNKSTVMRSAKVALKKIQKKLAA